MATQVVTFIPCEASRSMHELSLGDTDDLTRLGGQIAEQVGVRPAGAIVGAGLQLLLFDIASGKPVYNDVIIMKDLNDLAVGEAALEGVREEAQD